MSEDYIVIKTDDLKKLTLEEVETIKTAISRIDSEDKYYVINQKEPYAQAVIDLVSGADENKVTKEIDNEG